MNDNERITRDNVKSDTSQEIESPIITSDSVNSSENKTQDNRTITDDIVNYDTASTRKNTKYPNLDILSADEARKRGRAGGKKSGETRKARKTMRESLLAMLEMELSPEKLQEMGVDISTLDGNYTMQGALVSAMLREAVNGSEKAMQLVRDTIGEAPKQEIVQEVITKDDMELLRRNIVS